MNPNFHRGSLLLEQGRFEQAVEELRNAVAIDPDTVLIRCTLALALLQAGHRQEAVSEAETALAKDPGDDYAHWMMARIRLERNELKEAELSIRQAIELDPECAMNRGLLAHVLCEAGRNEDAVAAADSGLAIDASNDHCLTYRARALMALGRKNEAAQIAAELLEDDPEDAWNHCLRGDQLITQGEPAAARVHYLEALRIDPRNGYARSGLATSLKARSPIYGVLLRILLWSGNQRGWAMWTGIILLFVGMRFGDSFVLQHPDWMVPYEGVKALFWALLILVMIANPVFDLLLRFDKEGRHALSPDELRATNWFLPCLGLGTLFALWAWFGKLSSLPRGLGMASFFLCFAVAQVFESTPGYVRRWMAILTITAGAALVLTPVLIIVGFILIRLGLVRVGLQLALLTIWMPAVVMIYTAFTEEIRNWLEKRRPDNS